MTKSLCIDRYVHCACAALVLFLLSGCGIGQGVTHPHSVDSSDQAAAVLVSATATPWATIAAQLQPNLSLTSAQALAEVAPVTQSATQATASSLGATLAIGLLGHGAMPASGASGPAIPSTPAPPAGSLPSATILNATPPLDPMLKYLSGAALFQFVQLLNTELTSNVQQNDMVPYVVRLKITVFPYQENLPYDLYSDIAFFNTKKAVNDNEKSAKQPETCMLKKPHLLPKVIPLLVTDDIERATGAAVSETARGLALALTALTPTVGAAAAFNTAIQKLNTISGQNFASNLTVGRTTDNTLAVRIGAPYQQTAGRALVSRNYEVALILLVPKCTRKTADTQHVVRIYMQNKFLNAINGKPLKSRSEAKVIHEASKAINYSLFYVPGARNAWDNESILTRTQTIRDLFNYVQTDHWDYFSRTFENFPCAKKEQKKPEYCVTQENTSQKTPTKPGTSNPATKIGVSKSNSIGPRNICDNDITDKKDNCPNLGDAETAWVSLASLLKDSKTKSAVVYLPPLRAPVKHNDEETSIMDGNIGRLTVLDDGKQFALVQIATHVTQIAGKVTATLHLVICNKKSPACKTPSVNLVSDKTAMDPVTGILTFQFASPKSIGLSGINNQKSFLLVRSIGSSNLGSSDSETPPWTQVKFPISYLLTKASPSAPSVTVSAATKYVVESAGGGTVGISIHDPKNATYTVTADGGQIIGTSAGKLVGTGVSLPANTAANIKLQNLVPGIPLTIKAKGAKGSGSTGAASVMLIVEKS